MSNIMKIKANTDNYQISEVGCFEKPIGMVMDIFGEGYSNLFYMILKLYISYNVKNFYSKRKVDDHTLYYMNLRDIILKEKFNIILHRHNCTSDLHKFIEEKINKDNAVLIPGNLYELYYSKYYKKRDWPHLFLINGYDKDNRLYYIFDSTQFYRENLSEYKEFVIEYDVMEKIYKSYQKTFLKELYYIDCSEIEMITSRYSIILNCLQTAINDLDEQPYKELQYFDLIIENLNSEEIVNYYLEELHRTTNAKGVFYNEIIKVLDEYNYETKKINKCQKIKDNLLHEWSKVINAAFMKLHRGNIINLKEELAYVMSLEEAIRNELVDAERFMVENKDNFTKNMKRACFENNEDDIIRECDNHNYIFNFASGKVYSSWFKDDSPKVVISTAKEFINGFIISSKVRIKNYNELSNFHAGIFMRTEQNYVYFWGTHCGNSLRMDLCGIYTNIYEIPYQSDEVILCIEFDNNSCILQYVNEETKKIASAYKMELSGNIMEIGIGCKTWGESTPLKVEFLETKIYAR